LGFASIVPVKALAVSKKRLATILSPKERADLTLSMLEDVLNTVRIAEIALTVVISPDPIVERIAKKTNSTFLYEKQIGLNNALDQATKWLSKKGLNSILILPSDIPLISPEDITGILGLATEEKSVVLSSSRNGGTNALFKKPANLVPTFFGPNSFNRHVKESLIRNVKPKIYESTRIGLDIDSSEDLKDFFSTPSNTISKRYLEKLSRFQTSKKRLDFASA
jgi:2-phospho-L-lactate/phosphoenolpyruvate guanylyltransferase